MWRAKIIGYLVAHDLMCVIEGKEMKYRAEAVATFGSAPRKQENKKQSASSASALTAEDPLLVAKRDGRKVYGVLMLTLDGEALQTVIHVPALIQNEDAAATVWGILLRRYERNTVASKLATACA
jgi:hypothetical protein